MTDIGALIAPRPLLIASADRDWIFDIEAVREVYRKLKRLYELLGASENVKLIETPGAHSYHERSRRSIFAWFMKHLRDEDVPPEEIDDIDDRPEAQESVDALRVFISGAPHDERTTTIQDDFIPIAAPPHIETVEDLKAHRKQLVAVLRRKTFGAFPKNPPDVDVRVEVEQAVNGWLGYRISYTSEENLRLLIHFIIARETQVPAPTLVVIPMVERGHAWSPLSDPFVKGFDSRWTRAFVDVRGVGDTAWHSQLQWHLRRAGMLTGRTIASMRIYDVLRAIEALKRLEWVDEHQLAIAGEGEMAVVALFAALLHGDVRAIVLHAPPATLNAPSNPDGTGAAIELLNCLQYTDLPYVAGLMYPAELVFVGGRPESYRYAEELYARMQPPGVVRHVLNLSDWHPVM